MFNEFAYTSGNLQSGLSVIGPRATYIDFANKLGANYLDLNGGAWTWAKNIEYLKGIVTRGDDVIFADKFDPTKLQPSVLKDEIDFLIKHGYKWVEDFSKMVR